MCSRDAAAGRLAPQLEPCPHPKPSILVPLPAEEHTGYNPHATRGPAARNPAYPVAGARVLDSAGGR